MIPDSSIPRGNCSTPLPTIVRLNRIQISNTYSMRKDSTKSKVREGIYWRTCGGGKLIWWMNKIDEEEESEDLPGKFTIEEKQVPVGDHCPQERSLQLYYKECK